MRVAATLADVVELMTQRSGGLTFIDGDLAERRLGYGELAASARSVAAGLQSRGVRPGDRVGLIGRTSPELVIGLFGAWSAGAVPVILPLLRRRQLQDVQRRIDQIGAHILLVEISIKDALPSMNGTAVASVSSLPLVGRVGEGVSKPDDLALLQFTSGSTAHPRAVGLSHRQVLHHVRSLGTAVGATHKDVWVSWLPLYHDMGLIWMIGAVVMGATMVLEPPEDFLNRPSSWLDAVSKYGGTGTVGPNFAFDLARRDLELNPRRLDLSALRVVCAGAEPIKLETLESFIALTEQLGLSRTALCPAYGLAEATVAVTISRPDQPLTSYVVDRDGLGAMDEVRRVEVASPTARTLVSCGPPIPGTEIQILDADGDSRDRWRVGEIAVRSPSVMMQYWSEPQATAEVLRDGWLRTGDLGFLTDDGELVVCGRLKDMIIVGGHNIYPEEYEAVAESTAGVRPYGTIAFALPERERMVLVVEMRHATTDPDELARRVLLKVRDETGYAPGELVMVRAGSLPKTSSGKKQRALCRDLYLSERLPVLASVRR